MRSATIVAIGHSHLVALREAVDAGEAPTEVRFVQLGPSYNPIVRLEGGQLIYNERADADFAEALAQTGAPLALGSILGAESVTWAIHGQSRPFDVELPFAPDLPRIKDAEALPYGLLRHSLYDYIASSLRVLGHFQALTGIPIIQVLPPPPVAQRYRMFDDSPPDLQAIMRQTGVPSWIIQYKLWLLWNEIAAEIAAADGIRLLAHPPETVDAMGLLRAEFCGDHVHGNARYGALVLRQFQALLAAEI